MESLLDIYIILNIFIIGTLFGSFFSLATYRLPRKQDIVSTRSYCPNCKHNLGFFDLIPVLSYILNRGKCRYCKDHISMRYIMMEIANGLIFILVYFVFGLTLKALVILIMYICMFLAVGTTIMKAKMSKEELESINNGTNSKKGVFLTELIIAMIMFTMVMASTFISSINSNKKIKELIITNDAKNVAFRNMEIALATTYETLYSSATTETVDNVVYSVSVDVFSYADEYIEKEDLIKTVDVKVDYYLDGVKKDFTVSSLKLRGE